MGSIGLGELLVILVILVILGVVGAMLVGGVTAVVMLARGSKKK